MRHLGLLFSFPVLLSAAQPMVRDVSLTTPDGFVLRGALTSSASRQGIGNGSHGAIITPPGGIAMRARHDGGHEAIRPENSPPAETRFRNRFAPVACWTIPRGFPFAS